MSDIQQLAAELALIEARRTQIRREMLKHWDEVGSYEASGYHVAKIQTIRPEYPNPVHVANIVPTLINDNQIPDYLLSAYQRISVVAFPGYVRGLPIGPEVMAALSVADADGGLMEVIGKPRKVIVKYEPGTGKREGLQHVLEPGEEPLAASEPEGFEDEEGEELADGLSAGD